MEIRDKEELVILTELFKNLLSFYDLDYTLNVFKHEVNLTNEGKEKELRNIISQEGGN